MLDLHRNSVGRVTNTACTGQAISYKLGERAWLAGRDAARAAHAAGGSEFDLKSWHMSALSLGSLGLDDLTDELAAR